MDCVNLKEPFGHRYRVEFEQSYYAERSEFRSDEAPWLMTIPCQNGHIFPWGGSVLAASTKSAGAVASRLKALPFTTLAQGGSDGATVLFDVEHFDEVAEIMKPRRRRRLSPEHRRRLAEAGADYRFGSGSGAPNTARESRVRAQAV